VVLACIPWTVYTLSKAFADSRSQSKALRKYFILGALCFGIAFIFWLIDRFLCDFMTKVFVIGYPQFHALWHVMISFCFWFLALFGILFRLIEDKQKYRIKPQYLDLMPSITIIK